jgi:hypothetical protein
VHSNGVLLLAAAAGSLIWAFDAQVTRLIQLYIIGVFTSFTLSQLGMVRHWTRPLRAATDASDRRRFVRLRLVNGTGAALTGVVLVIVLVTKFTHGAWIVVVAMPMLYLLMQAIHRHYSSVNRELWVEPGQGLPPAGGTHAVVLVSKLHKPTLRALSYARATHPTTLVAVTVAIDDADSPDLEREWEAHRIPVELVVLRSPYREITRPVLAYVRRIRRRNPGDVVSVFLPEYVVGRWWEHLLHNQSALRLKVRLLFQPGVMVTSVPWQLASSERVARRPEPLAPGMALRADETVVPDEQISAQATAASGAAPGRDRSHGQA